MRSHELSNVSHELSNVSHELSNASHELSNASHEPSNVSHDITNSTMYMVKFWSGKIKNLENLVNSKPLVN